MSMISVAWPLMTAEPSTPMVSLPTWMSSLSSTMSTISSTTRPIERPASENTSSGCAPSVRTLHLVADADQRHELAAVLHQVAAVGELDLLAVDLFEARDQRQRHRLGLVASRRGTPAARRSSRPAPVCCASSAVVGRLRGGGADGLRDAVRIDDHDHRAVAEDGVAREHVDVTQLGRHRLDDDFLGVEHAVDHDAEGLVADLGHHDEAVLRLAARRRRPSSAAS